MGNLEGGVKRKTALALVLLLHFLAHPAVHAPALDPPGTASLSGPDEGGAPATAREGLGTCLACRTASAALSAPEPLLLPADSAASQPVISPPLTRNSVLYSSLLSARAPPLG